MDFTALSDSISTASIISETSFAEVEVLSARSFISLETTEKLLPWSPDCAAIMAAFSARRFVSSATSCITSSIFPISLIFSDRLLIIIVDSRFISFVFTIPPMVDSTVSMPALASRMTSSANLDASAAFDSTSFILAFICMIEEETWVAADERLSMFSDISLMEKVMSLVEAAVSSTLMERDSMLPTTSFMLVPSSWTDEEPRSSDLASISV